MNTKPKIHGHNHIGLHHGGVLMRRQLGVYSDGTDPTELKTQDSSEFIVSFRNL